jgi:hypothetical protein
MPYRTVAVASGLLVIVSLAGLLLTTIGNTVTRALGAALIAWLAVWATWGTVQLTGITAQHAVNQSRLEAEPTVDEIEEYKRRQSAS